MNRIICLLLVCYLLNSIFPTNSYGVSSEEALREVQSISKTKDNIEGLETKNLRIESIKDTAMSAGIQAGIAWKYKKLLEELEIRDKELNKIFNFAMLLLEGDVLPPVIIEIGPGIRVENESSYTSVIKHYKIIDDAKFVSIPTTWRDYFSPEILNKETINNSLLPNNKEEQEAWNTKTKEGFEKGIDHAQILFSSQFSKMVRDFQGMVLYHKLAKQNIISTPNIVRGDYRITVTDKELMIGERVFRVVTDSVFQDETKWKTR